MQAGGDNLSQCRKPLGAQIMAIRLQMYRVQGGNAASDAGKVARHAIQSIPRFATVEPGSEILRVEYDLERGKAVADDRAFELFCKFLRSVECGWKVRVERRESDETGIFVATIAGDEDDLGQFAHVFSPAVGWGGPTVAGAGGESIPASVDRA